MNDKFHILRIGEGGQNIHRCDEQNCGPLHLVFCPALPKLALDLHVNFGLFVCLFVCLSGLFFKASNWIIYWLLTVVLATYLSD